MKIFIYPDKQKSYLQLTGYCEKLSIPKPICWDCHRLNSPICELIREKGKEHSPSDIECRRNIQEAKISAPVILFYGMKTFPIKEMIKLFKADNEWPIMAVITPQSMDMTLLCLIGHLLFDRHEEDAIKAKKDAPGSENSGS